MREYFLLLNMFVSGGYTNEICNYVCAAGQYISGDFRLQ